MEIFSLQFVYALGAIVIIDLVLAGDNAIVIALAARTLPRDLQKRAIVWGTVGAIAVRILMTVVVVWLLQLPGLRSIGGALLLWIAYKLLAADESAGDHEVTDEGGGRRRTEFWDALRTIVIADAVMGLDNVLGVAGAAKGSYLLVVLGLAISIPIMIWGSTMILKWVERFPVIIYVGAAVLVWTAASMIFHEPWVAVALEDQTALRWLLSVGAVGAVLALGYRARRKQVQAD